jgi:hypothetical protein
MTIASSVLTTTDINGGPLMVQLLLRLITVGAENTRRICWNSYTSDDQLVVTRSKVVPLVQQQLPLDWYNRQHHNVMLHVDATNIEVTNIKAKRHCIATMRRTVS